MLQIQNATIVTAVVIKTATLAITPIALFASAIKIQDVLHPSMAPHVAFYLTHVA